jgi:hypothetical protein
VHAAILTGMCYDLALIQMRAAVRGAGKADAPAVSEIGGNGW